MSFWSCVSKWCCTYLVSLEASCFDTLVRWTHCMFCSWPVSSVVGLASAKKERVILLVGPGMGRVCFISVRALGVMPVYSLYLEDWRPATCVYVEWIAETTIKMYILLQKLNWFLCTASFHSSRNFISSLKWVSITCHYLNDITACTTRNITNPYLVSHCYTILAASEIPMFE